MSRNALFWTIVAFSRVAPSILLLASCFDPDVTPIADTDDARDTGTDTDTDTDTECRTGDERCPCFENGTCHDDLVCLSKICVRGEDESGERGSETGETLTASEPTSTTSFGTTGSTTNQAGDDTSTSTSPLEGSGTSTSTPTCAPSATEACPPDDTCSGTRTCAQDGMWGECVCDPARFCEPGAFQCSGEQPQRCNEAGDVWVDEGNACRTGEGCNARAETCVTGIVSLFNGWIHGHDNALGVQGSLSISGAGLTSTEADWDLSMCLRGTSGNIPLYTPEGRILLCESEPVDTPPNEVYTLGDCPYPRVRELLGVRITIGGEESSVPLRLYFVGWGQNTIDAAFVEIGLGTTEVLMEDARGPSDEPPVYDEIVSIHVRAPDESEFSFCVSELVLLW